MTCHESQLVRTSATLSRLPLGNVAVIVVSPGSPRSSSERRYLDALRNERGVVLANFTVNSQRRSRQIDALVIKPWGAYVVEVKGTPRSGLLEAPADWMWSIDGEPESFHLNSGNPGTQVSLNAKIVKTAVVNDMDPGFINALVVVDGDDLQLKETEVISGDSSVVLLDSIVDGHEVVFHGIDSFDVARVHKMMRALGVPTDQLPAPDDLVAEGFAEFPGDEVEKPTGERSLKWTLLPDPNRELARRTRRYLADVSPGWRRFLFPARELLLFPVFLPVFMLPFFALGGDLGGHLTLSLRDYAQATFSFGTILWVIGYLRARFGAFVALLDVVALFAYPVVVSRSFAPDLDGLPPFWAVNGIVGWSVLLGVLMAASAWWSRVLVNRDHERRVKALAADRARYKELFAAEQDRAKHREQAQAWIAGQKRRRTTVLSQEPSGEAGPKGEAASA